MTDDPIIIFPEMNFGIVHKITENPDRVDFRLHNHDDIYELVLFLGGEADFHVEGNVYPLHINDILLTRPFELHHIVCRTPKTYERIIIYIETEYFEKNRCAEFEEIFKNRPLGSGNLIPSEIVKPLLREAVVKIKKYSDEGAYIAANGVLTEFLYLLNKSKNDAAAATSRDKRISSIIMYINENLSEKITLDELSEKFFIDKYHMCRIFKKNTGYTLSSYINYKRILLVRELHAAGQSLLEASTNAGFNNYSHFYRMCIRQTGRPPKNIE